MSRELDDNEPTKPPAESPASSEVGVPRLSVFHLMMWVTFSAIYLALYRAVFALQENSGMGSGAFQHATGVLHSVITGAEFTAATVLIATRLRVGRPLFRQPGHVVVFVCL